MTIGGFSLLNWGKGNDSYTRTPQGFRMDQSFVYNKQEATFEVVEGREAHLYETTSEVQIVVNRFASMLSAGRWVHKRKDGTKTGKVIEDSALVELLENPNPLQSGERWLLETAIHYHVFGNVFVKPEYTGMFSGDYPYLINNLPPDQIRVVTTGKRWDQKEISGIIKRYEWKNEANSVIDTKDVILFTRPNIKNPVVGRSLLSCAHMPISNIRASYGYRNVNLAEHGALGVFTNKTKDASGVVPINTTDKENVEKALTSDYGIGHGQRRFRMVDYDMDFLNTSPSMKDAMTFEEVTADIKVLIDLVQLNDNIFSKEKSKIQANLLEGLKMGYQDAIIPFAGNLCSTLKRGLGLPNKEWLEIDFSHLPCMQEDEVKKATVTNRNANSIKTLVDSGYTKEEARIMVLGEGG